LSVNISGRQLDTDDIADHLRAALEESGLDPVALTVEISETALMRNLETSARWLDELKAIGVNVSIDGFGTGYSSLSHLQRLPVDSIKIDRSFTNAMTSPESDAVIATLVQLGKNLGLKTLAEGVEARGQVDHRRGEQVDGTIGSLPAEPLDPDAFAAQLLRPAAGRHPG
jgi:EAL domain-containing protein (putative c-di-GMP-specific phosphodiesterase class I)